MEKSWGNYKNKTESQKQETNAKMWECQKTPDSRDHYLTKAHPKASVPTMKPSSTQEPTSFRARHTKLILQQHRNITLNTKIQAAKSHTKPTSKHHRHLKTHYWTPHCTPERRDPAPPTRTPMQASLTRKRWQAARPTPPTGRNLHYKEEPKTFSIQKGHPKHSNLNKWKGREIFRR